MNNRSLIIAEAGVNHNGSLEIAKMLVDAAIYAGVDIIKFQTFKAKKIVSKSAKKAGYQKNNVIDIDDSQFNMIKSLELDENSHKKLFNYCHIKGIEFLSTGFDEESIDFLDNLGISLFKIPSGEITNLPYLQHIARKLKPIIMSTGMANLCEIETAINILIKEGVNREMITILHCNTEYPTPMCDVNLLAMNEIKQKLDVKVGYSDHTVGIEVAIAAVALGACVIEKHFTLDKNLPGPDHKASLEPDELKAMVKAIRNIEDALSGDGIKKPSPSEIPNTTIARKSIHYSRDLKKGHILKRQDLIMKRPGNGISPMEYEIFIGKMLINDVLEENMLRKEDFE